MGLLSEDEWTELLQTEIKHFCTDHVETTGRGYNEKTTKMESTLRQVAKSVLREVARDKLKEMLAQPEWEGMWENGRMVAGEKIRDMVREEGGAMFTAMIASAVQVQVEAIKSQISQIGL